jgi:hypothetical protein
MALSFYRIYKSKQGGNAFSPPKSGPSSCPPRKEQTHWHDQPWRQRCRAARTLTYLSQSKKAEAVTNTEDTRKDEAGARGGARRVGRATDRGAALRWCLALSVSCPTSLFSAPKRSRRSARACFRRCKVTSGRNTTSG